MRKEAQQTEVEAARAELSAKLRSRRSEIESAIATRVYALADPTEVGDPEYLSGLRTSLPVALEFGLTSIEQGERRSPPIPPALAAQARAAARHRIGLDTVLRRYLAGYTKLAEFALQEVEAGLVHEISVQDLLQGQTAVFDRLIGEVSAEYRRAAASQLNSNDQRRAERVSRLLAGESIDSSGLGYELEDWHLAAVAAGQAAVESLRGLAGELDRRLLLVRRDDEVVWAWLGSRYPTDPAELSQRIAACWPEGMPLAVGEPGQGGVGWRLSHRQAAAAFPLARPISRFVRYADVALLASTLQDDLLTTSLRQLYLTPLEDERDGGKLLRETLRAYLSAGRNVSSAAAALGVSRQTVMKRLHIIEERLGRYLDGCTADVEAALRLDELEEPVTAAPASN